MEEQAKQDVEAKRLELAEARAKLMARAGGQAGPAQHLDMQDAASNGPSRLTGIPFRSINDLRIGSKQLPLQSVDLDHDQFSLLANKDENGIIKEDRQQLASDNATIK